MIPILATLAAAGMLAAASSGCSSSQKGTQLLHGSAPAPLDSTLEAADPQFAISTLPNHRYGFNFVAAGNGMGGGLHRINLFSVVIVAPDGTRMDSVSTTDINTSGTMNAQTKATSAAVYGGMEWAAAAPVQTGAYAEMTLSTESGSVQRHIPFDGPVPTLTPEQDARSPIEMTLDVDSRGTGAEFTLRVHRRGPAPEGEYLPTGEKFRIEILSDDAEVIWSSSKGMMFTQGIGVVEPREVGGTAEYRALWSGMNDRTHGRLEPGTYRIVATIPAKPAPYIIREEFTWSGR
ncbi:MAG TPA: BsuPI-related putative proteinase inhibitor [Candidatus Kapabacteria bacterium]|nr:BsuPI-related putative proteinase inhibitor [Candidatus Kapabacteria bacterium]